MHLQIESPLESSSGDPPEDVPRWQCPCLSIHSCTLSSHCTMPGTCIYIYSIYDTMLPSVVHRCWYRYQQDNRTGTVQRHRDANGATHTERGPGPSNTTIRHKPPDRPEPRPGHTRVGPGTKRSGLHGPETVTQGPDKPPERRATSNPHLDPRAPRPGQPTQPKRPGPMPPARPPPPPSIPACC